MTKRERAARRRMYYIAARAAEQRRRAKAQADLACTDIAYRALVARWLDEHTPRPGHIARDECPACGSAHVFAQPQWATDETNWTYSWFVRECVRCGAGWTYDQ